MSLSTTFYLPLQHYHSRIVSLHAQIFCYSLSYSQQGHCDILVRMKLQNEKVSTAAATLGTLSIKSGRPQRGVAGLTRQSVDLQLDASVKIIYLPCPCINFLQVESNLNPRAALSSQPLGSI
jgi:hypothetical protein